MGVVVFLLLLLFHLFFFWIAESSKSNSVGSAAKLYTTPRQKRFTSSAVCFWPSVVLCRLDIPPRSRSNRWCIQQAPSGSWIRHQEHHQLDTEEQMKAA